MTPKQFVSMVANMRWTNDADDAIATVNRLIEEARKVQPAPLKQTAALLEEMAVEIEDAITAHIYDGYEPANAPERVLVNQAREMAGKLTESV